MSAAPSAFVRVVPRNRMGSAPVRLPAPIKVVTAQPSDLLPLLRLRCAQEGVPAVVADCVQRAQRVPKIQRALLLQRLTLALADDTRAVSPSVVSADLRDDACGTYRLSPPPLRASYAEYQHALNSLYLAIGRCGIVLAGTYGFIQQSVACAAALRTATSPEQTRRALSGWLNWQWSAVAAFGRDPLLRGQPGLDPLGAVVAGYALEAPSLHRDAVRAALQDVVARQPVPAVPLR